MRCVSTVGIDNFNYSTANTYSVFAYCKRQSKPTVRKAMVVFVLQKRYLIFRNYIERVLFTLFHHIYNFEIG